MAISKLRQRCIVAKLRGYKATPEGDVIAPTGTKLVLTRSKKARYRQFTINIDGMPLPVRVHQFVGYLKYGARALGSNVVVRHKDDDPDNNSFENIRIGTQRDNMMDQPRSVRVARARHAARSTRKLNPAQMRALLADRAAGATYAQLMAKYKIAKSTVSYVVNGKTYKGAKR